MKKIGKIIKNCHICNCSFESYYSNHRKTCSIKCGQILVSNNMKIWHKENRNTDKYKERNIKISESNVNTPRSVEQIKKQSKTMKSLFKNGKLKAWNDGLTKYTDERVRKNGEALKKTFNSKEWKESVGIEKSKKISLALLGKNNPRSGGIIYLKNKTWEEVFGKFESDNRKRKQREFMINYVEKKCNGIMPNHGEHEDSILDHMQEFCLWEIKRQHPICGYFVDGYVPELNLVIEIDERPKTSERDIRRENEIKEELNCKFLRIKDY